MIASYRDGRPVVCVKDRTSWTRDPRTAGLIAELPEAQVEEIYDGVRENFWSDVAPDVARKHDYSGEVYSLGRSGGWLALADDTSWVDYVDQAGGQWISRFAITGNPGDSPDSDDVEHNKAERARLEDPGEVGDYELACARVERDRWVAFALGIHDAVKACGDSFAERLSEAYADLERAREDSVVRSEN